MGFWGFFSLPVALSGVTMCDSPHTPPDICGKRVSTPKTTPIQDAVEPSSSEVVFKHRPVGNVINIPAGSVPQKRPVPISGVTRRVQGVGTHGASPALPASTGTPLLIPPGLGAGICRHKQKAGKIPNGCGNSFLNLGGGCTCRAPPRTPQFPNIPILPRFLLPPSQGELCWDPAFLLLLLSWPVSSTPRCLR